MKDQLIEKIIHYMETTGDFVLEQAPEICQEILNYSKFSSILCLSITGSIVIFSIFFFIYSYCNRTMGDYGSLSGESFFKMLFSGAIAMILLGPCVASIDNLIKINVAPKYYILQIIKRI